MPKNDVDDASRSNPDERAEPEINWAARPSSPVQVKSVLYLDQFRVGKAIEDGTELVNASFRLVLFAFRATLLGTVRSERDIHPRAFQAQKTDRQDRYVSFLPLPPQRTDETTSLQRNSALPDLSLTIWT